MDPLTAAVVTVLGKYALDKGATLFIEAGQVAVDAAARLFHTVMERLKADPAEAKNAERFEKNPEDYKQPMADAIEEKIKADPKFAAQLKALIEEIQRAERAAGVSITTGQASATASEGGVAVGSVSVGGSVSGGIQIQGGSPTPPKK